MEQKTLQELLNEKAALYDEMETLNQKIHFTRRREWSEKFGIQKNDVVYFKSKGKRLVQGLLKMYFYNGITETWMVFVTPYLKSGKLGTRAIRVYPNEQETLKKYEQ
jgi:hypothetical protein